MSKQNIYDNDLFFDGYYRLRKNQDSANNLEEKPALFSMLPCLKGKKIIDLGCGYGENCKAFADMGAEQIVGIDISKKMLAIARKEHHAANIEYRNMPMEDLRFDGWEFDVAVSSLAIHYVRDFEEIAKNVYSILAEGGLFIFSQEHPLTTAPISGAQWVTDADGNLDHYRLTDYARSGKRSVSWLVDGVIKYHRTFSDLLNALITAGFIIEETREPVPTWETVNRLPHYAKDLHKPNFLIIKAKKSVICRRCLHLL